MWSLFAFRHPSVSGNEVFVSDLTLEEDDPALIAAMEAEDREHGAPQAEAAAEEPADEEPAADPEPAAEEPAEPDEPEKEPEQPAKQLGIASKDGKTVLPYAALRGARAETKQERALRLQVEAERDALKQELEDLKAGKAEPDEFAELVDDFPATAKLVEEVKALREQVKVKVTPQEPVQPADDPVQEAIDTVPLLAEWQASDPEKWARATAIDNALRESPKWKSKPMEARFEHVARMVAEEFDIQTEQPASVQAPSKARQDPDEVVKAAKRTAPNTLSDFKGGTPSSNSDNVERLQPDARRSRVMAMSDEEIDRWLAKQG